ncbi:hypothetical protein F4775DRAFT_419619 [Biscogniauxia sp. FL1348]|nr:hypothetical protein F4775DRAFT_419619 [Biscogniauxia sp. FL1348]
MENQERATTHSDPEGQRENSSPVTSMDTSGNDSTETLSQPLHQRFHGFPDLPSELRVMVYQMAAWTGLRSVRTIGTHQNVEWTLVVKTLEAHRYPGGLWQVSSEARAEVGRLCIELPTHLITDIGANVININEGLRLRRMASNYVGERPYHAETAFFMNEPTAVEVFRLLRRHALQPQTLGWLRNLVLDKRAFQHVLGGYHVFSHGRGGGGPFILLPSLEKIVVGVMHPLPNIALLEGRYDDVLTEVQIVENPEAEDEEIQLVVQSPYELPLDLELVITDAARQTRADVRALEEAGINVVWGVIRGGITERPDVYEWFFDL